MSALLPIGESGKNAGSSSGAGLGSTKSRRSGSSAAGWAGVGIWVREAGKKMDFYYARWKSSAVSGEFEDRFVGVGLETGLWIGSSSEMSSRGIFGLSVESAGIFEEIADWIPGVEEFAGEP